MAIWRGLPEVHRAAALWSFALVLSAALAPVARASAVKFALRSLGGVVFFLAAADLLDSRRAVERALAALGLSAVAASLLMALELGIGAPFAVLLRPFHLQTFGILGLARASGPFQYPNIATMYLEAALPALLAAGVAAAQREPARGRRLLAATTVAALLVVNAIVLAASRAGLVTALVVLLGLAVLARELPALRRLSIGLAAALVAVTMIAQAVSPLLALRLRFWSQGNWYSSGIDSVPDAEPLPSPLPIDGEAQVRLSIHNIGLLNWPAGGDKPVKLSYHWMSEDAEQVLVLDGARTELPRDLPPGERAEVSAIVKAPARAGRYLLWWDLVQENVTWFSDAGDPGVWQLVVVGTPPARKGKGRAPRSLLTPNAYNEFSRIALWSAGARAFRDHPLLGLGPDNFRHAYGKYLGRKGADERLHANNFYVEVMATMGILGVLALVSLMVALARTARRALEARERTLALGVTAGLAAYFIHGTLDYLLEFTPTYVMFWLLAAALVALERLAARDLGLRPAGGDGGLYR
jgi:O-antigen ligase